MKSQVVIQPFGKKAKYVTWIVLAIWVALMVWLFLRSTGSFLPAWFLLQSLSLLLLIWIGMPKKIIISRERLLLVNTLRLVSIPKEEIESIDKIDSKAIPAFATMGLMGHFGIYYFKDDKCFAETFARSWENLIMIKCTKDKKYVIGVNSDDDFLKMLAELSY